MLRLNWQGTVFLLALAAVWEIAVDTGLIKFQFLPAPSAVFVAWWELVLSGQLLTDSAHTLVATLVGWLCGCFLGVVFGIWIGLSSLARRFGLATGEIFRAAPGIAFVPVIILIFGFTISTEIITIIYVSIWPVLVNAVAGAQAVTPIHRDTVKTLQLSKRETITEITLPTSVPFIMTGMKLSLTTALALAVVVEMIGNPAGLGYAVIFFQQSLQPAAMLAIIVWVGLIGLALNFGFDRASALLPPVKATLAGA